MKRKIFIGLSVIALIGIFAVGQSFAGWYYSMNLVKVAASESGVIIKAENDAGTVAVQKYLSSTIQNQLLAVALTAQSTANKVHIYLDTGTDKITQLTISTE